MTVLAPQSGGNQRRADTVIRELVQTRFAPGQSFNVAVSVGVIAASAMAILSDPVQVGVSTLAPLHERCFSDQVLETAGIEDRMIRKKPW